MCVNDIHWMMNDIDAAAAAAAAIWLTFHRPEGGGQNSASRY